jgi:Zn-dependent M28 family amino/carboxypeptidase
VDAVKKGFSLRDRNTKVRFGWWGAEEIGLIGSKYYVDQLITDPEEFSNLIAYFNYDMEAGPNYVRFVFDAETAPEEARQGSRVLEAMLQAHFNE